MLSSHRTAGLGIVQPPVSPPASRDRSMLISGTRLSPNPTLHLHPVVGIRTFCPGPLPTATAAPSRDSKPPIVDTLDAEKIPENPHTGLISIIKWDYPRRVRPTW